MFFANVMLCWDVVLLLLTRLLFVMFPNDRRVWQNFRDAKVEGHSDESSG